MTSFLIRCVEVARQAKWHLLNNRQFIGVDISQDYIDIAKERIGLLSMIETTNL